MTDIAGTRIIDKIVPYDSNDTYPTHSEIYGQGGWRTVANITARDAITTDRRIVGMLVNVLSNSTVYELVGGITNSNWQIYNPKASISTLTDVFLTNVQPGQTLITDGINWYNANSSVGPSISAGESLSQGSIPLDTISQKYTILHSTLPALSAGSPIVSLQIPTSADNLLELAILNRTLSSFDVILSQIPDTIGYYINWSLGIGGGILISEGADNITILEGFGISSIESPTNTFTISVTGIDTQANTNDINTLFSTYANSTTVESISSGLQAQLNNVVHLSGDEVISGSKKFINGIEDNITLNGAFPTGDENGYITNFNSFIDITSDESGSLNDIKPICTHINIVNSGTQEQHYSVINSICPDKINLSSSSTGTIVSNTIFNYRSNAIETDSSVSINNAGGMYLEGNDFGGPVKNLYQAGFAGNYSSNTITNAYGIYSGADTYNGTISASYKLYLATNNFIVPIDENYGIYQEDPTAKNYFGGNVEVKGDMIVSGTQFIVNSETISAADNLIIVNGGEIGTGVTRGVAGIEVERGTAPNYMFNFEEARSGFTVGMSGQTQLVATRVDVPIADGIAQWDSAKYKFYTVPNSTYTNSSITSAISAGLNTQIQQISGSIHNYVNKFGDTVIGVLTISGSNAFITTIRGSGTNNEAFGNGALANLTTGSDNTGIGYQALNNISISTKNTAVGSGALAILSGTSNSNTAVGYQSLNKTGASNNTAVGYLTNRNNTSGIDNCSFGWTSMSSNTIGQQNSAFGSTSLSSNTIGSDNVVIGYGAIKAGTNGSQNTVVGTTTLYNGTTHNDNAIVGWSALTSSNGTYNNSIVGSRALYFNTTGHENTAIGYRALYTNITGNYNVVIGNNAAYNELGSNKFYVDSTTSTNGTSSTALMYGDFTTGQLYNKGSLLLTTANITGSTSYYTLKSGDTMTGKLNINIGGTPPDWSIIPITGLQLVGETAIQKGISVYSTAINNFGMRCYTSEGTVENPTPVSSGRIIGQFSALGMSNPSITGSTRYRGASLNWTTLGNWTDTYIPTSCNIGYNTSGATASWISANGLNQNVTMYQPLIIDTGTASGTLPTKLSFVEATIASPDGVSSGLEFISHSATSGIIAGRNIGGTRASPTDTNASMALFQIAGYGRANGIDTSSSSALLRAFSDGAWGPTNTGTYLTYEGTPAGTTTRGEWFRLQNGSTIVGTDPSPSGSDKLKVGGNVLIGGTTTSEINLTSSTDPVNLRILASSDWNQALIGTTTNHDLKFMANGLDCGGFDTNQELNLYSLAADEAHLGGDPGGTDLLRVGGAIRMGVSSSVPDTITDTGSMFVSGGALYFRGGAGTITKIANA